MNAMVQTLNTAGRGFVGFAVPMLIQASLLIVILLIVNVILRGRVRAVFRYWIWMLVLVKLVLPPSLWSPVSLGTWFGEKLEAPTAVLLEVPELSPAELPQAELSPVVTNILSQPPRMFVDPPRPEPMAAPPSSLPAEVADRADPLDLPSAVSLNWQGLVLLVWLAVVTALLLLLAQRTFFVRGLVAQADEAGGAMLRELDQCRRRLSLRRPIALRLSPSAASPAVCGLIRPVILVPQNLASRLHGTDLQAVLFHELAHVKRGDLWLNLIQTLLQIIYFYNPLLWLANAIIRRIREKAVDETVLVALGDAAPQYPETLVNVAKLAFRRPALSLRLIGVVESKNALTSRIKHILNRPLPKTARLGAVGLVTVALVAAVLLPMARGRDIFAAAQAGRDQIMVVRWMAVFQDDAAQRVLSDSQAVATTSKSYQAVRLGSHELLTRVRDCVHGNQVLYLVEDLKWLEPSPRYPFADAWSYTTNLQHPVYSQCSTGGAGPYKLDARPTEARLDLQYEFVNSFLNPGARADGSIFCKGSLPPDQAWVFAAPLQKSGQTVATHLVVWQAVRVPKESVQRIGSVRSAVRWIEDGPSLTILRERMPLLRVIAHQYYQKDTPVWIYLQSQTRASWKPNLEEICRDPDFNPCFLLIDGKEYDCQTRWGPFDRGSALLDVTDNLYMRPGDLHLPVGKHTIACGWKNVDVVDPNAPDQPVHFDRLSTDPAEFEVVAQIPPDYYRPVYEEGWEDVLRANLTPIFTDDIHQGLFDTLLGLRLAGLPFDTAFAVYIQAEGSEQQYRAGEIALTAGVNHYSMACDHSVKELNWDTVGDKRWRIILKPSVDVAKKNPPIHTFYAREFVTGWLSFQRSPQFEQHRREFEHRRDKKPDDAPPARTSGTKDFARTLPNGVTVELLGICEHPSAGKPWWRPEGGPLERRPYDRLTHTERSPSSKQYEVLFHIQGAASEVVTKLKPGYPQITSCSGPCSVQDKGWAQTSNPQAAANLFSVILCVDPMVGQVPLEVGVGMENAWEIRGALEGQIDSGSVAVPGAMFGPAVGKDGRTSLTVAHRILDREIRVIALDKSGKVHKPTGFSAREGPDLGHCQAEFDLPIANIASIQLQTQQLTWVTFPDVPLDPNLSTRVAAPTDAQAKGETPVVLPEVDRQPVLLDLATGQLVPVPPVGPDPEKIQPALRKLGKGDLLYDCIEGERALGLLRDATSEQAQVPAGEPSIKGHLIGARLPEVMTIKTAEGGQYRVTILAADDMACTLKYSPVSTDKGAGGGALVEPEKAAGPLELRIAPTSDELASGIVEQYKKALAEGRMSAEGRYLWIPVRPGINLGPLEVTDAHAGKTWLLVHNQEPFIMVPSQGWRLARVDRTTDADGRRAVRVDFDDAGTERLLQLTKANGGKALAEIVNGVVVSAPIIMAGQSGVGSVILVGSFTEQEIDGMIASLRPGMVEPSAGKKAYPLALRITPAGEGSLLSGVVVDASGQPLQDVRISNWYPHGSMPQETKTDAQGRFSFAEKRGYVVKAEQAGLAPEFCEFREQYFGAWKDKSLQVTLTMTEGSVVTGTIRSRDGGAPLRDVQVWVELEAKDTDVGQNRYVLWRGGPQPSDPAGRFEFRHVPDGTLRVAADANGFAEGATESFPLADKSTRQIDVTLRPKTAQELQQDRLLEDARRDLSLSGTVTDEAGRPVAEVEVSNYAPAGSNPQRTRTDADGRYRFAAHRGYVVVAKKDGFAPAFHEFKDEYFAKYYLPGDRRTGPDRRGPITIDLTLTRGATLTGLVRSGSEGAPAVGLRVHLERQATDPDVGLNEYAIWKSETAETDGHGQFAFEHVPAGIVRVFVDNVQRGQLAIEGNASRQIEIRLDTKGSGAPPPVGIPAAGTPTQGPANGSPAGPPDGTLARRLAEAQAGGVVTVPKGRYTMPVEISKPLTLRGEAVEGCILEVTADQPALLVNTQGQGQVTVENLTIRWQTAGNNRVELPAALLVKGTNALIRNCRFAPLGDFKRSPMAIYIDRPSRSTVDNCRFSGFDYVVCYGQGTEGIVQDCLLADCGHQGVINYDGATLTIQRNIITGSKFHAVRCTGGILHVKDNLLIKNANRGIYLGNKTGRGTITNNVIVGNGTGISGFGRADYVIANNVIVDNSFSGIDMRDSCRFSIHNNVLVGNQRGLALFKEGTQNFNVVAANVFWSNATEVENLEKPADSVTADPQFTDPDHGDFTARGPVQDQGHGLTNPQVLKDLWQRYEQLRTPGGGVSQPQTPSHDATPAVLQQLSGRVVDPNGRPVAGAQVALCTKDKGVVLQRGQLVPTKAGGRSSEIVNTDAQGRFAFSSRPPEFHLVAAHDLGFAWVTGQELAASGDLRLEPWGRIEGTLRIGRELGVDQRVSLHYYINKNAIDQGVRFDYQTQTDAEGRFSFERVPPTWLEVGYLIRVGDAIWTDTSRTPIHLQPGESLKMTLGGEGRPVIGKFVPPEGYQGPIYFGEGLRSLATWRPEWPKPANYDQMTKRQQQEWLTQWLKTPEAEAFYDAIWHDLNRRHYAFRIQNDGAFRIEDVVPGRYKFTIWLEERPTGQGRPEEIGSYYGTIEVPAIPGGRTDEPLDLGNLTVGMRNPPLHVGDLAPLFEAKSLAGQDIRLIDYRGKFVLLSFWQPTFHPEVERLKELQRTYGADRLQIIDFAGSDTLAEVQKYIAEHQIEWPEIYLGENKDNDIAKRYGDPVASYILLVNPEGTIVATWLRGEKLTSTVRDILEEAHRADRVPLKLEYPEAGLGPLYDRHDLGAVPGRTLLADAPPVVLVPGDVANVARGRPVTCSSSDLILGDAEYITDGNKKAKYFVEFEPQSFQPHSGAHVTIDLGQEHEIYAVAWWHDFYRPSVYWDVVLQVSRDPQFKDATTLFNNDRDNSLGLGSGTDWNYIETNQGWVTGADGVLARYVRLYNRGNSRNMNAQYTEVEVYGCLPQ